MYKDINDVHSAFPHFFGENAMHVFDSKVETSLETNPTSGRQFFVTSERITYRDMEMRPYYSPRLYTVREVLENDIRNYSEFCSLTFAQAATLLYKVTHEQDVSEGE